MSKRNMITSISRLTEYTDRDFLGPDIDAGFRIAKFVERKRLLISAHLAGLLHRERASCEQIEKRLKIVSYEVLKGVWDGRRYPIIWYEDDWANVDSSFLYDEHFSSPLIATIRTALPLTSDEQNLDRIEKIFSDLGRADELNTLYAGLATTVPDSNEENDVEIDIPPHKYSEVHCVAVCFGPDGRVLVGRRPSTKKRFPNCWEFGCGQLQLGETFFDCLKHSYLEDFGAHLELPEHPIPISTFSINDSGEHRKIPGVIFLASILNPHDVEAAFLREKHSEIKWVDPDNCGLLASECVPHFSDNLRIAHSARKSLQGS
jgi:hypothetical protein